MIYLQRINKFSDGTPDNQFNTENSKLVLDQVVNRYWWLRPMRELIMDHGSEFGAPRVHEDGTWNGSFKQYLEEHDIRPILGMVAHPQTNGKLERFFREYKRHRPDFASIDEFMNWYNDIPHGSLDRLAFSRDVFQKQIEYSGK